MSPLLFHRCRPLALGVAVLLCATACGSNSPKIPPELLAPLEGGSVNYPAGPYGAKVGDTLANLSFQGWRLPTHADGGALETISFADYYDPDGTKGAKILIVNTTAIWCVACKAEHTRLPEHYTKNEPLGLRLISALFEDVEYNPATRVHLEAWVDDYLPNYPMVLDPEYHFSAFTPSTVQPLNLIVDARTMKIMKQFTGDKSSLIWPYVEAELAARASQ